MVVDQLQLIERASALSGLQEPSEVSLLLEVTTRALAACLSQPDRQQWAATLPRSLRELLLATPFVAVQRAADVYAAVARAEGVNAKFGVEHAQAAVLALASDLPEDTASTLARHLPTELGELLLRQPSSGRKAESASHVGHARPVGGISTAAPGSTHPVSEAAPKGAQSGSVGAWDSARMDHSLGSGHGPAEPADTLAEGRPGSTRGLSDVDPERS